jgi:lipoate-protein ligase A
VNISVEGRLDGYTNMSRDVDLLERAESGESGARIYEWDGAWVSLGNSQVAERDLIDGTIRWVMRPTGGKAVLHGHDLTVSVALPTSGNSRAVKDHYRELIKPLVAALSDVGQDAALAEETRFVTRGMTTADCFLHISPNDVIEPTTGRKLIGCAMRATKDGVLAQCSIPLAMPLIDPAKVYRNSHVAQPLAVDKEKLREAAKKNLLAIFG